MSRLPLQTLNAANTGLLLGGQASAWQPVLAEVTIAQHQEQLLSLLNAAWRRCAPIARELNAIHPGARARLEELISEDNAETLAIDGQPAVSVPGIFLSHIVALDELARLELDLNNLTTYAHSQATITKAVLPAIAAGNWADNQEVIDHLAFALVLGAATSAAHFGRMLAIRGVPVEVLRELGLQLAVVNSPTRAVVSGSKEELSRIRGLVEGSVEKHNELIASHTIGGDEIEVEFIDLGVDSAFHHPQLAEAAAQASQWATQLGLQVDAKGLAQGILVEPFEWSVGEHEYLVTLDKGIGTISEELSLGVVVDASSAQARHELLTPGVELPAPVDFQRFAPTVQQLPDGKLVLSTRFTKLTGYSPVLLAGMTPTTVDAEIVAAAANAGHWAELAGGGQYSEEVFAHNNGNLQQLLEPGRSAQFNSMFFDRYMWNLQFGQQRIVSKARAGGAAINGVTISAGIPELEEASELIAGLQAEGFPYIALKPGTIKQIEQVLEIADHNPQSTVIMQVEDGHAGGHHSWVDLHDLLLATYAKIRQRDNVVLVVGGGIGTPEKAETYLLGTWALDHGRPAMPVDGMLVGTAAMATREAKTSPQVKQALVDTPGIPEGWVGRLHVDGGMTSGQSHLLADLYEIENDFAAASRLITSLDPDSYVEHREEIIAAINKTAKPYFGEVEEMTYAQWLERFVDLAYPFSDPTWSDRFFDLLHRVEARLHEADHGDIPTLFASIDDVLDAPAAVETLLRHYPQARELYVSPRDAAWFIRLHRKHHKPMPWVPVIDGDLKRWFGLDSLWQSQDERYPAHAVRVIPGPLSVAGITKVDEPVAELLQRFEQRSVDAVLAHNKPTPVFSRLAGTAVETILSSPTISWHGHLIDNPAATLPKDAFELIALDEPEQESQRFILRILADSYWDDLPAELRPYSVDHVDIPLDLSPAVSTGASPVVSHERLPEAVFDLLAGVAGVGSTSASGDEITSLPSVEDGLVRDSFTLTADLLHTHAGVAGGDRQEITVDALVGPCWPAIYMALGTGKLKDGYPVIEGLLNAVHLDHVVRLDMDIHQLRDLLEEQDLRVNVESRCASIEESASGRIVTVELELATDTGHLASMIQRFAIRGRAQGTQAPAPAPEFGGMGTITATPRSFITRTSVHAPADMTAFATVTGDYNPIHTSTNAAQLVGLPAPLVHGMWLSATAQQVAARSGTIVGWTYSMFGMVQLKDEVEITVERVGRIGLSAALEVTCRIHGDVVSRGQALLATPKLAYVYPGQGIQTKGMGQADRNACPAAKAAWERADLHTRKSLGFSIIDIVDNNPTRLKVKDQVFVHPQGVLNLTQFTQVALAVVAFAQTERLRAANAISDCAFYAGHSLGEYTALASLGNIFDLEAVIDIVFSRGSAMHSLVPRDEHGRSNYGLGALRPNMIGVPADQVEDFVAQIATESGEYLEIVNYNISGQQYAVAGTLAGLQALQDRARARHPKAFVMIPGIDVPFHSAVLRPGVPAFAEKLDELLPQEIDIAALEGRYIPNLVARPFALTQDFIDAILDVVPATRLQSLDLKLIDANTLARLLLIELLSWQFASPVRWIETQELLINEVDQIVEVGLASSPTLTNLALRSMEVLGTEIPVLNVERDQQRVQLEDVTNPPAMPDTQHAEEQTPAEPPVQPEAQTQQSSTQEVLAQETPTQETPTQQSPEQRTPSSVPSQPAGGAMRDLEFFAADAIDVLFAYQNKIRVDQITSDDTTEILTGGVSSRRNQLLMDMSAELGVAAIDGAADAPVKVLHERVNVAAPTYQAFGPVLSDAIQARLRQLFGAAGVKPTFVADIVRGKMGLPESWIAPVEAALLLDTREGESVRGGQLATLNHTVTNKAEAEKLVTQAVEALAAKHGIALQQAGAGSSGVQVDSAALDALADEILGEHGVLATTAREILAKLGHLPEETVAEPEDDSVFAAMDAELGAGWLKLVEPVFDARKAIVFDDAWAIAREKLARVAYGATIPTQAFAGTGKVVAQQARWWTEHVEDPAIREQLQAIAAIAEQEQQQAYANDVAIVTGAAPDSIATAIVEKLLAGGATVVMTASRIDQRRKEFARKLYEAHASAGAVLWLVPANLSSFRDTDALVNWIGTAEKASVGGQTVVTKEALAPTLVFPFAAPKVHGLMTDAGPAQENQARLLMWSLQRLIAKAAQYQELGTVHVVLPGSPNRGTFGGDGAYGEVKAGLDALVNKWHVESGWPEKITLAHAYIGWVAGTNLMGGNDRLIPLAKEAGIRVYTPAEIANELLELITPEARNQAAQAPLEADLTGGLAEAKISLRELAQQLTLETPEETVEDTATIPALPHVAPATQPAAIPVQADADLDDMVVIVGVGEVSSWGFGRTRFEAEYGIQRDGSVELTAAGVLELAWMMGLITWKEDPAPGWYDTQDALVEESDIYHRYRDEVIARCGIRQLSDKYFLKDQGSVDVATVYLDRDIEFTVTTEAEARDYLEADPATTRIARTPDGEWKVTKAQGAVAHIPKKATLTRTVAGQMPDDFDPARWGIPASMLDGLDRIAVWNLVTAVDAFLSSGFTPSELLQHVHPGLVSSTQGTGIGGMESLHKVFVSRFLGEDRPSDILQEALPNVVAAHVMQSYVGGYGQMIHPVAACATAAVSVEEGVDKIRLGKSDVVIAGGIDDVQVESLTGFGDMNATAETAAMLAKGIDPRFISRANDTRRGGFLEAEGGGTVILARGCLAKELGLPVLAIVAHAQSYADGAHTSIPAPGLGALGAGRGGTGSALAKSLRALGLTPDDVRVVSKHDTSTNANDPNESNLHSQLWAHIGRDSANPLFVISQKSLTGHAKGGAALFQIGGLIDVFQHNKLPGNMALDCVDKAIAPKAEPLVWLKSPLEVDTIKAGVLTSLGFGHVAAVVVLAHPGIFAHLAGPEWVERANARLRAGHATLERGMIGRGALYEAPANRRLPQDADAAERQLLLDDTVRLGANGYYPG